jgi:hypothetical protein
VPGYLTRLTREPVFQGKSFGSLQMTEGTAGPAAGSPSAAVPAPAPAPASAAPFVEFSLQSNSEAPRP